MQEKAKSAELSRQAHQGVEALPSTSHKGKAALARLGGTDAAKAKMTPEMCTTGLGLGLGLGLGWAAIAAFDREREGDYNRGLNGGWMLQPNSWPWLASSSEAASLPRSRCSKKVRQALCTGNLFNRAPW